MNGQSPFWDAVRVGIEAGAKDFNVPARLDNNDATPEGQIQKLRQYVSQTDIAAVGLSATDAANPAIADEMRRLRKQNVHVITLDSDVDRERAGDARFAFIGTDNFQAGQQLGRAVQNLRPDGGEYVTFVGRTGAQNAIERVGGFADGVGSGFTSLDNMGDQNDRSRAKDNVRNAMQNHPGLNALVGIWSYNAPAIVDVLREKNARDKYTVAVFDAEPLAIRYMEQGDVDAMVVQNPYEMGYQAVRLLKALVEDDTDTVEQMLPNLGEPGGELYDTGLKMVVPEGSPLSAELFSESTEFMTLPDFQAWLKQYNLVGS